IIIFLVIAISGEIWQIILRNKSRKRTGYPPETVLIAKVSMYFALLGAGFAVVSAIILVKFLSLPLCLHNWADFISIGIIWDTGICAIIAIITALLGIIQAKQKNKYGISWSIFSILISLFVLLFWFSIYIPLIIDYGYSRYPMK
ncbi:hypothetical protein DRQ33_08655, partial [bacterium]